VPMDGQRPRPVGVVWGAYGRARPVVCRTSQALLGEQPQGAGRMSGVVRHTEAVKQRVLELRMRQLTNAEIVVATGLTPGQVRHILRSWYRSWSEKA